MSATVKIGEYEIPLIGIPDSATQQKCSICGKSFHISEIKIEMNGEPKCSQCEERTDEKDTAK